MIKHFKNRARWLNIHMPTDDFKLPFEIRMGSQSTEVIVYLPEYRRLKHAEKQKFQYTMKYIQNP